jgi:hypothetical protein
LGGPTSWARRVPASHCWTSQQWHPATVRERSRRPTSLSGGWGRRRWAVGLIAPRRFPSPSGRLPAGVSIKVRKGLPAFASRIILPRQPPTPFGGGAPKASPWIRPMLRSLSVAMIAACALVVASSAQANLIVVPTVEIHSLTHDYSAGWPPFMPAFTSDSMSIGDGNYSGGGAFSIPSIATGDTFAIRIQAPAGKKFVVHEGAQGLSFSFFWLAAGDGISLSGGTATFENLAGTAPTPSYEFMGVGNGGNVVNANLQYDVNGAFEFTAIDILVPVQSNPVAGPRNFGSVQSSSAPSFTAYAPGVDQVVMSIEVAAIPELGSFASVGAVVTTFGVLSRGRRRAALQTQA